MAEAIPTQALDVILDMVKQFPQGAAIDDIEARLASPVSRRTLQRWLQVLISQQRLQKYGQARATRYLPPLIVDISVREPSGETVGERADLLIPLSKEGADVESHVRQPLQKRTPVGYRRAFLDSYRPNESFYLPEPVRAELLAHGQAVGARQPAGAYARQIAHRLLIDLSWNSSRLEGNTYSLLETERLIRQGEAASGKGALEAQMILNHKEALEFLIDSADEIGFNRYTLLNLHAQLSDNLLADPTASGRLRSISVGIGHTVFLPLEGPQRIDECFQQVLDTAAAIADPFEQAFFAMVHLPYLQPFEDVNKRVSRLAANIPLIKRNLCPLSFVDVPQQTYVSAMLGIYECNRIELLRDVFVWAYKRSCARYSAVRQSLGEPDPFRLRYRQLITEAVANVVRGKVGKAATVSFVRRYAEQHVPMQDRARLVEVIETQLLALHEGSIARYRLRPSEYQAWKQAWD
jgi:hypothetical protein